MYMQTPDVCFKTTVKMCEPSFSGREQCKVNYTSEHHIHHYLHMPSLIPRSPLPGIFHHTPASKYTHKYTCTHRICVCPQRVTLELVYEIPSCTDAYIHACCLYLTVCGYTCALVCVHVAHVQGRVDVCVCVSTASDPWLSAVASVCCGAL